MPNRWEKKKKAENTVQTNTIEVHLQVLNHFQEMIWYDCLQLPNFNIHLFIQ